MKVKIIADSAADLPVEVIEDYGIEVLPLQVVLGSEIYRDRETISPEELFDGMREGKVYSTSQVAVGDFQEIFKRYAAEGRDCLYPAFSSQLSGTYQAAVLAAEAVTAEYPGFKLEIVDTKCASLGGGLVVLKAAELAREGRSLEDIKEVVEFYSRQMEHIFTVDNLEYLYRGGRISRTSALVGGLLNIKPILSVEDGKLVPLEKTRGRKKVLERIVNLAGERGTNLDRQTIGISHGDDLEGVETLKGLLKERYGCQHFLVNTIGAVIGAHAGPGTLAVFFLNQLP